MTQTVLVTGGAGFIGSHLTDVLIAAGDRVRILDNLCPQVHGTSAQRPAYLHREAELIVGDVRDRDAVQRALRGVDKVCHLAAAVGVGQSMYQIENYLSVNNTGTAVLLEALIAKPVEKLVVASSMSIYGEGAYQTADGAPAHAQNRSLEQLKAKRWELRNANGEVLVPIPTPEEKVPALGSVYALSKFDQERLCLMIGEAYRMPICALRFFNVYGPRQALSNPYTGVLAIFASQLLNGNRPLIFEDGEQRRDFVNVRDVARACQLALDTRAPASGVFNIASGCAYSVREVAERLARQLNKPLAPKVTERYRVGDIRHCFADIQRARSSLGFDPRVSFDDGLAELVDWLRHEVATDHSQKAHAELLERGLSR